MTLAGRRILSPQGDPVSVGDAATCDGGSPTPSSSPSSSTPNLADDRHLAGLIAAWPTLPAALKAGIAAMVSAAREGG